MSLGYDRVSPVTRPRSGGTPAGENTLGQSRVGGHPATARIPAGATTVDDARNLVSFEGVQSSSVADPYLVLG